MTCSVAMPQCCAAWSRPCTKFSGRVSSTIARIWTKMISPLTTADGINFRNPDIFFVFRVSPSGLLISGRLRPQRHRFEVYAFHRRYWFTGELFSCSCAQDSGIFSIFALAPPTLETSRIFLDFRIRYPYIYGFVTDIMRSVVLYKPRCIWVPFSAFRLPRSVVAQSFAGDRPISEAFWSDLKNDFTVEFGEFFHVG